MTEGCLIMQRNTAIYKSRSTAMERNRRKRDASESTAMMKFLLAVAAAFCAVQGLSAMSLQLDDAYLDTDILELDTFNKQWLNVTEILEKVHGTLAFLENKIDEITVAVEDAIKNALDVMESVASEQAARWNDMLQEWVDRAQAAGVDVKECLQQQDSLAAQIQGLRNDAQACTDKQVAAVRAALADVTALRPVAERLVADTAVVLQSCLAETNPLQATFCLVQKTPQLAVRGARLGVDATLLSGRVGAKAAAIGPLASLCASRAAAGRGAAATRIIDSSIKCIRGKLDQQ